MDAPDKYDPAWCGHMHSRIEQNLDAIHRFIYGNGKAGADVRLTKIEDALPEIAESAKKFRKVYAQMIVVQTIVLTILIPVGVALAVNHFKK